MRMMKGLDLTDAQKASLKAIADKHRDATKPQHEAAMAAMKAFHEAMMNPASTGEQLKALHDKASQAEFELALDRRAMMQESLAILTPEQKAKAEKLRAEWPKDGRRAERGESRRHGMAPEGPAPEPK
jgi:Spy/CpxP family protein refolding chaperone